MAAPTPTPKTVSQIKDKLLKPALTSHFLCEFLPPNNLNFKDFIKKRVGAGFNGADYFNRDNQDLITLSCSEASLPGSSLATHEINNDYTGVTERHVYRRQYDDRADFIFYVDQDYKIIDFFENWMSFIVDERDVANQATSDYSYRSSFPEDYKTNNLYITKFEKDYMGRYLQYQFINAFPISINSIPISYEASDLLRCTVSFTYSRYVITKPISPYQTAVATMSQREKELRNAGYNVPEGGIDLDAFIRNNPPGTPPITGTATGQTSQRTTPRPRPRTRGQVLGYE